MYLYYFYSTKVVGYTGSDDRLVNAANTSVRSYVTVNRPVGQSGSAGEQRPRSHTGKSRSGKGYSKVKVAEWKVRSGQNHVQLCQGQQAKVSSLEESDANRCALEVKVTYR